VHKQQAPIWKNGRYCGRNGLKGEILSIKEYSCTYLHKGTKFTDRTTKYTRNKLSLSYNAYRILVGGKRRLGRPKHGWVDNIKMDLREIGWDGVDWIDMAQVRDQ
jgi:hypothetical protein